MWNVATDPRSGVLYLLAATALLAWPLGRRLRRGPLGVVFVAVAGAVLAATASTPYPHFSAARVQVYLAAWTRTDLLTGFAGDAERLANIALLLPLALLATLLWRRPVAVVLGCTLFSFAIEGWQAFAGGRAADPVDVIHNTAGAALGAVLALTILAATGRRRSNRRRPEFRQESLGHSIRAKAHLADLASGLVMNR